MPMTVRVGLSAKRAENFQSEGVSIELAAELDQGLLQDAPRLQNEIAGLYRQARNALHSQQAGTSHADTQPGRSLGSARASSDANGVNRRDRPLTDAQLRALRNLAPTAGVDLDELCREQFACEPAQLSLSQASGLIDAWKPGVRNSQRQPAGSVGRR